VKECCIPEDWKPSVVLPLYREKGDPMDCGSYRMIKLLKHAIFEYRIQQQIETDDMQLGFMKGKGTTDAILLYTHTHTQPFYCSAGICPGLPG